jgi:hypothetical protein
MMKFSQIPSDIGDFIAYNPETGAFTHKVSSHRKRAGTEAGTVSVHGYLVLKSRGKHYFAQRVAWFIMTGEQPPAVIDHADGDRLNNRFINLRAASHSQNQFNSRPHRGKPLPKGVKRDGNRFVATIQANWIRYHLGYFDSPIAAAAAYEQAATKLHGEFARFE